MFFPRESRIFFLLFTMVYTHPIDFKEDDYVARIAHSEAEICLLIEAGFEYVCDSGSNKVFRKRK